MRPVEIFFAWCRFSMTERQMSNSVHAVAGSTKSPERSMMVSVPFSTVMQSPGRPTPCSNFFCLTISAVSFEFSNSTIAGVALAVKALSKSPRCSSIPFWPFSHGYTCWSRRNCFTENAPVVRVILDRMPSSTPRYTGGLLAVSSNSMRRWMCVAVRSPS